MDERQQAVSNAFRWVHAVYREGTELLTEAAVQLGDRGFKPWGNLDYGGRHTTYLFAQFFSTATEMNSDRARDVLLAISFYPDPHVPRGDGPRLLCGVVHRSAEEANKAISVVNVAARAPGEGGLFRVVSKAGDPIVVCDPSDGARREYPWVAKVTSFELPLTSVRSTETVAEVVGAVVALRDGDPAPAHKLLGRFPG